MLDMRVFMLVDSAVVSSDVSSSDSSSCELNCPVETGVRDISPVSEQSRPLSWPVITFEDGSCCQYWMIAWTNRVIHPCCWRGDDVRLLDSCTYRLTTLASLVFCWFGSADKNFSQVSHLSGISLTGRRFCAAILSKDDARQFIRG